MISGIAGEDRQIGRDVRNELRQDPRIEDSKINVLVRNGEVTLTGTASNYACEIAAQAAANRVDGVLNVRDDVEIRLSRTEQHNDAELTDMTRRTLAWDVLVPDHRIRSSVTNGWITLEGTVDRWSEREDAGHAVEHLAGVRGVLNDIRVQESGVDPAQLRRTLREALGRHSDEARERLEIEVRDGIVRLRGHVRSSSERCAVLGAVGTAPGIRGVEDHLRVDGEAV